MNQPAQLFLTENKKGMMQKRWWGSGGGAQKEKRAAIMKDDLETEYTQQKRGSALRQKKRTKGGVSGVGGPAGSKYESGSPQKQRKEEGGKTKQRFVTHWKGRCYLLCGGMIEKIEGTGKYEESKEKEGV